jgi:Zn-dependent alcohol dehydrogenase
MRAAILRKPGPLRDKPLVIEDVAMPVPGKGEALLKVLACGVCRTDLHIATGELPKRQPVIIPGHQIVAEVIESPSSEFPPGTRVGVSWIGGTDGTCPYCVAGRENLCDAPTYTGYTHNGGFAEYTTARADFLLPLPTGLTHVAAAPLLCAGIIGFRSLQVAEVRHGQRVGLFGFGSSAQLMMRVLQSWDCRVYVTASANRSPAWCRMGGWRDRFSSPSPRLRHHLRSRRRRRHRSAPLHRQGWHSSDQRDPSRPHSAVRLRHTSMGRTPASKRSEHDATERSRLPARCRRDQTYALRPDIPPRPDQRGAASRL